MINLSVAELAARINATDTRKAVVYVAGGGTEVFPMLLARGGGSATLLAGRIPYDSNEFRAILGHDPKRFVDAGTARNLAMAAYRHALSIRGDHPADQIFGMGATSKLSRGPAEREGRSHEIHVAVHTYDGTHGRSVLLPDGGDRAWEERINALLLLNMIAVAKGVEASVPLEHETQLLDASAIWDWGASWVDSENFALQDLYLGRTHWVAHNLVGAGAIDRSVADVEPPRLLLPGSFRPLHAGHVAMAEAATRLIGIECAYELSIYHPEKPPLDYLAIRARLKGFEGQIGRLFFTNAPTYLDKARLFPGCTFVVGHDTALRIVDPRFYGGPEARDAMLVELESLRTQFLIFGRVDSSGHFRDFSREDFEEPVAGFLGRVATSVPGHVFRVDLSSTELRQRARDSFS